MTRRIVVAGTDTGVGKTIFSAALVAALDAHYWKPVQAGLAGETDSQTVARLSGLPPHRVLREAYRLRTPASPHLAARIDGVEIDHAHLDPPMIAGALVIETAGGVMTPLTTHALTIDVLTRWKYPVVLVARTALGAINHSLLTIEALRRRDIPILGVAFSGEEEVDAQQTIAAMGGVRALGRLPTLAPLTPDALRNAFDAAFQIHDFMVEDAG